MSLIVAVAISGLHGRSELVVRLKGQHCIIVGPNGTGKSSALQVLAYTLGRQWKNLAGLSFERIELTFEDNQSAVLTREACVNSIPVRSRYTRSTRTVRLLDNPEEADLFSTADLTSAIVQSHYSGMLRMDVQELRRFQESLNQTHPDRKSLKARKDLAEFQASLDAQSVPITLYLPTYRRTELDLAKILSNTSSYFRSEVVSAEVQTGVSTDFIMEMIRFGMEDINTTLQSFERNTRDFARDRFNRMMTSYLQEMANSAVLSISDLRSHKIDAATVNIVLSRIEEGLLSSAEKERITGIILELASGPGAGNQPFNKKWLAHFFVRLLEVNKEISSHEIQIREFVRVLSRYFAPKQVFYDIERYHFSIREASGVELKLSDLSSGEKQLVSIMSLLYLQSGDKKFNILIDEPELSLSVPWQIDLLPDLVETSACSQVFAVTHSPFIYDNKLSSMVVDFLPTARTVA